ncbi:MAG: molecular chaperone DnaJ [Kordiimonas sp.]|nr:molecular chaperone DnaJ [Kordiimonas sp.]|tara:strand:+ start:2631 stop:3557 length:927 start_codon:yes stop_codon:yes gene_type:complete
MKDPYSILQTDRTATQDELKAAYRKLAKKLHPDLHPGDEKIAEQFKEVSAAYALLSDKEMRARYDRGEINADGSEKYGNYRQHAGSGQGQAGFGGFGDDFNPEDLFASIFGEGGLGGGARHRQRQSPRRKGDDRKYTMTVSFLEAVKGGKRQITLDNGKTLNITIPENVKDGQQIRLKGQGEAGSFGGPQGDALIEVKVADHPHFTRKGNDIYLDLPITLSEAILGGKVQVPTLDGKVTVSIPKESNTGRSMRLKGKGATDTKTKVAGDLYLRLQITLPDDIDDDLIAAIEGWSKDHPYDPRIKLNKE